ncbi:hypothetical protein A2U01_0102485, partial [Trifolium medium]|nr:hypothetical protein [Trifolium medium]
MDDIQEVNVGVNAQEGEVGFTLETLPDYGLALVMNLLSPYDLLSLRAVSPHLNTNK